MNIDIHIYINYFEAHYSMNWQIRIWEKALIKWKFLQDRKKRIPRE